MCVLVLGKLIANSYFDTHYTKIKNGFITSVAANREVNTDGKNESKRGLQLLVSALAIIDDVCNMRCFKW